MKIKINGNVYDGSNYKFLLILDDKDKENIKNMPVGENKYTNITNLDVLGGWMLEDESLRKELLKDINWFHETQKDIKESDNSLLGPIRAESKSTDKLIVINQIISEMFNGFTENKKNDIKSMEIKWDKWDKLDGSVELLPNFKIEFK
jgi:hypothetical protein